MQTRAGRLIINMIYSLIAWLLPVTLGFLVTPFLLARLGVEAYGVYLVILGLIGYTFTFNLSRSVAKFVAEFSASGDERKINSAITAAFIVSASIGIFGGIIVALSADWAIKDVLQISPEFQVTAKVALMIGGIGIPFTLTGQVFQNILLGTNRFGALSVITNINWILLNAGNVALALLGYGVDALILWTVIVAVVNFSISYFAAKRAEPTYGLKLGSVAVMIRPVMSYGSSIFVYQCFGSLLLIFERGWLTRSFGAETASYYLVPMALVFYFNGFMSNLTAAVFPMLNELLADPEKLLELYKKSTKLLVSLTVLFILSIFFSGKIFLSLWIGPQFSETSYRLLIIHAVTFGMITVIIAIWQVNEAFNAARLNSVLAGVWAIVTIVLMVTVAETWKAEGVALSRTVGVAVTLPAIFWIEKRFLWKPQWSLWARILTGVGTAGVVLSLIEYFAFNNLPTAWISLVVSVGLGSIGYFLVLYLTGFVTKDEKAALLRALRFGRGNVN